MLTKINELSFNYFYTSGQISSVKKEDKKTDLTDKTKRELESLGISATNNMTEAEAQEKIAQENERIKEKAEKDISNNSNMTNVLNKIKLLADKLGIPYSDNEEVDDVLDKIKYFINSITPQIKENKEQLGIIKHCENDYKSLKSEFENIRNLQIQMYNSMDITANNNKFILGL